MSLTKSQRASLREMFGGRCAYCGHLLGDRWHADHIEAVVRRTEFVRDDRNRIISENGRLKTKVIGFWNPENERPDNYFPACVACNIDKSCEPLEIWRKHLQDKIHIALRASTPLRHAQRFGLVTFSDIPIVFYFEKLAASESQAGEPRLEMVG